MALARVNALRRVVKVILVCLLTCCGFSESSKQRPLSASASASSKADLAHRFRIAPNSTQVVLGNDVTLFCSFYEVRSADSVFWSKNDIIITDDTDGLRIEEFYAARYSLVGDRSKFEYNLRIRNVELDDDGWYTCQRPPISVGYSALIATAILTVLVPCEAPVITGYNNGSKVTIDPRENETLTFVCECRNGKPRAELRWQLNAISLFDGSEFDAEIKNQVISNPNGNSSSKSSAAKLESVRSWIELPSEQLQQADRLWCVCLNTAMRDAVSSYVHFNILSPPTTPIIESSHPNGTVIAGSTITLRCSAQAGNPAGNMTWKRISEDKSSIQSVRKPYVSANGTLSSELSFIVYPNDTGVTYQCAVQNSVSKTPMIESYTLDVLYGPDSAEITGKLYAKMGEHLRISCTSSGSNPAAIATWQYPQQMFSHIEFVDSVSDRRTIPEFGNAYGHITVSNLTAMLPSRSSVAGCNCTMRNPVTGTTVVKFINLTSASPPHQVAIYKSMNENALPENSTVVFVCIAAGSFPPATLSWYIGDTKVDSAMATATQLVSADIVTSNLTVQLKRDDNRNIFRCDATNVATDRPISASVTMTVYYPPSGVHVTVDPEAIREGTDVTLTCEAGSSNPTSEIAWFRDGVQIYSTSTVDIADAFGGWQKRSVVQFAARQQDDGSLWRCVVNHEASDSELASDLRLIVRHRPVFGQLNRTFSLVENQQWSLNVPLRANPTARTFVWSFNNTQLQPESGIIAEEGRLAIKRLRRSMTGLYRLVVGNSEGTNSVEFYLDVLYQISLMPIANRTVDIGQSVSFECRYDGNPADASAVNLIRLKSSIDLERRSELKRDGANRVVHMLINNVTADDAGSFVCVGDNRATGQPAATRDALLIVRFPPRIETRSRQLKSASRLGDSAELTCTIDAFPCAEVSWLMKVEYSFTLLTNSTDLTISTSQISRAESAYRCTVQSRLRINIVRNTSFGVYRCAARNQLSPRAVVDIPLVEPGRPDAPSSFELINASTSSVTLRWRAAFNGGAPQTFEIRYYDLRSGAPQKPVVVQDIPLVEFLHVTIDGLKMNAEYHVSLVSSNKYGESDQRLTLIARTVDSVPLSNDKIMADGGKSNLFGIPIVIFAMIGIIVLFLLILNVVLIVVCLRRKRTQRKAAPFKAARVPTQAPTQLPASIPAPVSAYTVSNNNNNNNNNATITNGHHSMHYAPLLLDGMQSNTNQHYGIGMGMSMNMGMGIRTTPPYGTQLSFGDSNDSAVQFLNSVPMAFHRNNVSESSDLQNIALNDFSLKEVPPLLRYTSNDTMEFSHPDVMEILNDRSTPTVSFQLKRATPADNNGLGLDHCSSISHEMQNASRMNGSGIFTRNGSHRSSPKHYVTFDQSEHNAPVSSVPRNLKIAPLNTHPNYVPVIYKPPSYQRRPSIGSANGSDRQHVVLSNPNQLDWANNDSEIIT